MFIQVPISTIRMKRNFFFLILFCTAFVPESRAQSSKQLSKIVLDAGHGGSDIGAPKYKLSKNEKDITLDVVLRLGKMLQDSMPDLKVIYTRTTDIYPKLQERHEIANKANADLFISIHVNSTAGRKVRVASGHHYVGKGKKRRRVTSYRTIVHRETEAQGTETYVLGLHRNSQKGKAIEDYGDNVTEEPGLLDENDPTTQIIVAQYTQAFLSKSINFASKVQDNFEKQARNSYGVKQKGLEVLAGSAMPGVLIEIGFINNPDDELYLNSESGQTQVALAIYRAIKSYKEDLNRGKAK
jgi:N-acetylmuramoyl-L-alanine amidase